MSSAARSTAELVVAAWRTSPARCVATAAVTVVRSTAFPVSAALLGRVTDSVLAGRAGPAVTQAVIAAALLLLAVVSNQFARIAYLELGEELYLRYDLDLVRAVNATPSPLQHEDPAVADRLHVVRAELDRIASVSAHAVATGLGLVAGAATTAVVLARLSPWLLLLPVAALPPLWCGRRAESAAAAARLAAAEPNRLAEHLFQTATDPGSGAEVRIYGMRDRLRVEHAASWRRASRIVWRGELVAAGWHVLGQLVFGAAFAGATLLVVRDVATSGHGVGDVVVVVLLAAQVSTLVSSLVTVGRELDRLHEVITSFHALRALADRSDTPAGSPSDIGGEPASAPVPTRLHEGIRLRDVSFRYPGTDRAALDGVDVLLPAGCVVGVVGENGAGKTTLTRLLALLGAPTSGAIEVDGVDLRRIDARAWRSRISAGFQDYARVELAVRASVGVGELARLDDDEAIGTAIDRGAARTLVADLPSGLDTQLGTTWTDGRELSGGQWQRIAVARAMMRAEPLLLLLDEPTSAFDPEAEQELFDHYLAGARDAARRAGTVTVLVSHRFSTVRSVDVVLVLEGGRLVECGSHEDLLAADGTYARMFRQQAAGYV